MGRRRVVSLDNDACKGLSPAAANLYRTQPMQLTSKSYTAEDVGAVQELYHANGWTDGLPVVPPTQQATAHRKRSATPWNRRDQVWRTCVSGLRPFVREGNSRLGLPPSGGQP